jgi:hypothetical protein
MTTHRSPIFELLYSADSELLLSASAGTAYYGPTHYGATRYGPTHYGPTRYGATRYGPTCYALPYYALPYYASTYDGRSALFYRRRQGARVVQGGA